MSKLTPSVKWATRLEDRRNSAIDRLATQCDSIRGQVNKTLESNQAYLDAHEENAVREMLMNHAATTCVNILQRIPKLTPEESVAILAELKSGVPTSIEAVALAGLAGTVDLPGAQHYASPYALSPQLDGSATSAAYPEPE